MRQRITLSVTFIYEATGNQSVPTVKADGQYERPLPLMGEGNPPPE